MKYKNSSGDEIANVNIFTTISHMYFKMPKREPTSFNELDDSYESTAPWIYESATEFLPCSYRIFVPWASRGSSADVYY